MAITYGLVETIKWLIKRTFAKGSREENKEQLVIIMERLKEVRKAQEVKEVQLAEMIRILDRLTVTQQMLAEITKDNNKLLNLILKRKRDK